MGAIATIVIHCRRLGLELFERSAAHHPGTPSVRPPWRLASRSARCVYPPHVSAHPERLALNHAAD